MDKILDGRKLADSLNSTLAEKISLRKEETGFFPALATILVGEDPASKIYVNIKHKTCARVGITSKMVKLSEDVSKADLLDVIRDLNEDPKIHGILLQLPLPESLRTHTSEFLEAISPLKDVDGFHPINRGRLFDYDETHAPCTPKGIIKLLEANHVGLKGKDVTLINRSILVGKPLMFMLLKRNATISVCHTKTVDIERYMRQADILVVAVGVPKFVTADKIKEGAVIIDVGTNRVDGELMGDVDYDDVLDKCSRITPVPGGVGPMTVSMLMHNTFTAYEEQIGRS